VIRIPILHQGVDEEFPDVSTALADPDGLLAAGGDLSVGRLLKAYRAGIFPWYSEGEPILWWSPDPRLVFATDRLRVSARLRRWLRHCSWTIRADTAFADVMRACAAPRASQRGTWITPAMLRAYAELHERGFAHSIEAYDGERLVGGIYGVAVGRMFFGESMFSASTNGSKVALLALCRTLHDWGFPLLDAQVPSQHLASLGAFEMARTQFAARISPLCAMPGVAGSWTRQWPTLRPAEWA
jgi:leucyl/phenylalanyl-tRNA--protein transferase